MCLSLAFPFNIFPFAAKRWMSTFRINCMSIAKESSDVVAFRFGHSQRQGAIDVDWFRLIDWLMDAWVDGWMAEWRDRWFLCPTNLLLHWRRFSSVCNFFLYFSLSALPTINSWPPKVRLAWLNFGYILAFLQLLRLPVFILLYDFPQIPAVSAYTQSSLWPSSFSLLLSTKSFPGACHFCCLLFGWARIPAPHCVYATYAPRKTFYCQHCLAC